MDHLVGQFQHCSGVGDYEDATMAPRRCKQADVRWNIAWKRLARLDSAQRSLKLIRSYIRFAAIAARFDVQRLVPAQHDLANCADTLSQSAVRRFIFDRKQFPAQHWAIAELKLQDAGCTFTDEAAQVRCGASRRGERKRAEKKSAPNHLSAVTARLSCEVDQAVRNGYPVSTAGLNRSSLLGRRHA